MSTKVSKTELKTHALELLRGIQTTGQPLIVTEHGKPVLQVRPWYGETRTPLELLHGSVTRYLDPTEPVGDDDWEAVQTSPEAPSAP